jgi:hypothetical protein
MPLHAAGFDVIRLASNDLVLTGVRPQSAARASLSGPPFMSRASCKHSSTCSRRQLEHSQTTVANEPVRDPCHLPDRTQELSDKEHPERLVRPGWARQRLF